ncbi:hypothetical protein CALCODRAFT_463563 [Calocera cornea HHB12733]|uniref:Protein ZIP4 homolog n=1 Tax=Calocera cornea HHB12733 TaxID=1353952 RepID=A0A165JFV6_9BASI|nr:hypothetical protein CALCODRAFT_463563 [Calocera cornea HHB12733]
MKGTWDPDTNPDEKQDINPTRALSATKWFRASLQVIDRVSERESLGVRDLKRATLRSLARALFAAADINPDSLTSSEETIHELLCMLNDETGSSEHLKLLWMKLEVVKKRKGDDKELLDAFGTLIDVMELTESEVTNVLVGMNSLGDERSALKITVSRFLLTRCLEVSNKDAVCRTLLTLLFYCKKNLDDDITYRNIETALNEVTEHSGFTLDKTSSLACQTMIVGFGDLFFSSRKWTKAAAFYMLAAHQAFIVTEKTSFPRVMMKAALSLINGGELDQASHIARQCPIQDARTHYLHLMVAVKQGREEDAITAVSNMVNASGLERSQLGLVMQLARDESMRALVQSVLEALLYVFRERGEPPGDVSVLLLYRCIIRLLADRLEEPGAETEDILAALFEHLSSLQGYLAETLPKITPVSITSDLQGLWRTVYNVGVYGCLAWEDDVISEVFRHAILLMDACEKTNLGGRDSHIIAYRASASFIVVSGKVFLARGTPDSEKREALHRNVLQDIAALKAHLREARQQMATGDQEERVAKMLQTCLVYEVEQLSCLKQWTPIIQLIKETALIPAPTMDGLQMIADILWRDTDCPSDGESLVQRADPWLTTPVLYEALEAILRTSLECSRLPEAKFCRWLRALCDILLKGGKSSDRTKALQYFKQAADVLQSWRDRLDFDEVYPIDERQWLLSMAYNTGIDDFRLSITDEGSEWLSLASIFCNFVPNGQVQRAKVNRIHSDLTARFKSRR